eukprot:TCALIF_04608-PA protein Name:"Protein of unknown function" AED:0.00 eAED:0.00 QI:19/1/1/1/1/1/2/160/13
MRRNSVIFLKLWL